jgi:hypothetical protein
MLGKVAVEFGPNDRQRFIDLDVDSRTGQASPFIEGWERRKCNRR